MNAAAIFRRRPIEADLATWNAWAGQLFNALNDNNRPLPRPASRTASPKRSRRPALFRQKDLERAVKGMKAATGKDVTARIDKEGNIVVSCVKQTDELDETTNGSSEWDVVLKK
jgi:hypothetical protein